MSPSENMSLNSTSSVGFFEATSEMPDGRTKVTSLHPAPADWCVAMAKWPYQSIFEQDLRVKGRRAHPLLVPSDLCPEYPTFPAYWPHVREPSLECQLQNWIGWCRSRARRAEADIPNQHAAWCVRSAWRRMRTRPLRVPASGHEEAPAG
jgi:hypothetical protein